MTSGKRLAVTLVLAHSFLLSSLPAQEKAHAKAHAKTPAAHAAIEATLPLHEGWTIQTSAKVEAKGEVISTPQFAPKGWHDATVPTTVVAALVKDKTFPDPLFGMNLRQYPGMNYPIGGNFSNIAMAPDSPYAVSWWYRKQFTVPASYKGKTVWLKFNGINYRANIWLNGKQIAKDDDVAGAWRTYEFNVTDSAKPGAGECTRRASLLPHRARSRHHLRRLEPRPSRQEHGPVARCLSHHQRSGRAALSHGRLETEHATQRQRATHRHRAGEERHRASR